jgi:hypothetical protein
MVINGMLPEAKVVDGRRFIPAWRDDVERKASRTPRVRVEPQHRGNRDRLRPVLDFREIDLSDDLAIVVEHAGEPVVKQSSPVPVTLGRCLGSADRVLLTALRRRMGVQFGQVASQGLPPVGAELRSARALPEFGFRGHPWSSWPAQGLVGAPPVRHLEVLARLGVAPVRRPLFDRGRALKFIGVQV